MAVRLLRMSSLEDPRHRLPSDTITIPESEDAPSSLPTIHTDEVPYCEDFQPDDSLYRRRASSVSAPELTPQQENDPDYDPDYEYNNFNPFLNIDPDEQAEVDDVISPLTPTRQRTQSLLGIQDQITYALSRQIKELHKHLKLKDNENTYLSKVPDKLTDEIMMLDTTLEKETAILIREANSQRLIAERKLQEARYKIDGMQGEVSLLRSLVLTSTPSQPNRHLHPQIERRSKPSLMRAPNFVKTLRRSISSNSEPKKTRPKSFEGALDLFKFKSSSFKRQTSVQVDSRREESPPDSPTSTLGGLIPRTPSPGTSPQSPLAQCVSDDINEEEEGEVDPVLFSEVQEWIENKKTANSTDLDLQCPFIKRVIKEDVLPCLDFKNKQLALEVYEASLKNKLIFEPISDSVDPAMPCCLTGTTNSVHFRIRLGEAADTYTISTLARNRIAVVCNFFLFASYVSQGLIEATLHTLYWDVLDLRKEMMLARLNMCQLIEAQKSDQTVTNEGWVFL